MYMLSFSGTYIFDKQGKYRGHAHSHTAVVYSHIHLISNRTCQTNLTALPLEIFKEYPGILREKTIVCVYQLFQQVIILYN